ncbi:MAG TPA: tape measure protein, partial [Ottowia sp.]|nr:tape measure protein [Ottowia sp.]
MADSTVKIVLSLDGKQYSAELQAAGRKVGQFAAEVDTATARASASVQDLGSHLARMGHAAAGALAVQKLSGLADGWASLNARVALASNGLGSAAVAMQNITRIANDARVDVSGLAETYGTLSKAGAELGYSQQRVLGVTETLSKAMTLSGGSAQSAQGAMVQFGQGLQAGVLRGEELNSVLEQAPRLAQALAEGLGQPVGALKAMAEQGQITTDAIFAALERMKGKIDSEFAQLPATIGQSMTVLQNSLLQTVGVFDQAGGLSRGFAEGILTVARNMDTAVAATAVAGAAYLTLTKSAAAAAVATRGLALATGLLGGPIGLLATALGVGASAWLAWKAAGTGSEKAVEKQVTESHEEIVQRIQTQIAKLRERNRLAGQPLPETQNQGSLDAAKLYTDAYARYQKIASGAGEFANLPAAARATVLKTAGEEMGRAYKDYTDLVAEMEEDARQKTARARETFMADYKDQSAKLADALAAYDKQFKGKVGATQYQQDTDAIRARFKASDGSAAALKKEASAYQDLMASIAAKTETVKAETTQGHKLTESQKLTIALDTNLQEGKLKLGKAHEASVRAAIASLAVEEQRQAQQAGELALAEQLAQARQDELRGIEAYMQAQQEAAAKSLQSALDRAASLEEEERAAALAAAQNITLAEAVERVAIARLREEQTKFSNIEGGRYQDIEKEIAAREKLLTVMGQKEAREALKKTADEAENELKRVTEQYEQGLTNAAIQGGKSLKEYVLGMLRATAFRIVLEPVMKPLAGLLANSLGGAAAGSEGGVGGMAG